MSYNVAGVSPPHKWDLGLNPAIQRKKIWVLLGIGAVVQILWVIPGLIDPA